MEEQPKSFFSNPVVIIIAITVVVLCCCALILGARGVALFEYGKQVATTMPELPGFNLDNPTPMAPVPPPAPTNLARLLYQWRK